MSIVSLKIMKGLNRLLVTLIYYVNQSTHIMIAGLGASFRVKLQGCILQQTIRN